MLVAEGGEPIALVFLGITVVANPDKGRLQEVYDRGQNFFTRKPLQRHVLVELRANLRQNVSKLDYVIEFCALHHLAKSNVVAVLLAASRVSSGGLEVPVRARRDPHVRPCGGNRQLANALQRSLVPYSAALWANIGKPASGSASFDARLVIVGIDKPGAFGDHGRLSSGFAGRHRLSSGEFAC